MDLDNEKLSEQNFFSPLSSMCNNLNGILPSHLHNVKILRYKFWHFYFEKK